MCEWKRHGDIRIDPCMKNIIEFIDEHSNVIEIVACCCGHLKYPMTIIVKQNGIIFDLISNKIIPRNKRFYKRDKQGVYYIPEVSNERRKQKRKKKSFSKKAVKRFWG